MFAAASSDAVDGSTLSFLLQLSLQCKAELEKREKEKNKGKRKKTLSRTAPSPCSVFGCCLRSTWSSGSPVDTCCCLGPGGSFGRFPHIPYVKVALALFAHGNRDFPRTPGIWHPLVRCLSRPRSTGQFELLGDDYTFLFLRSLESDSHLLVLVRLRSTGSRIFPGDDFQSCFRIPGSTADERAHTSVHGWMLGISYVKMDLGSRGRQVFGFFREMTSGGVTDATLTRESLETVQFLLQQSLLARAEEEEKAREEAEVKELDDDLVLREQRLLRLVEELSGAGPNTQAECSRLELAAIRWCMVKAKILKRKEKRKKKKKRRKRTRRARFRSCSS